MELSAGERGFLLQCSLWAFPAWGLDFTHRFLGRACLTTLIHTCAHKHTCIHMGKVPGILVFILESHPPVF